jgi:hypothetical protein
MAARDPAARVAPTRPARRPRASAGSIEDAPQLPAAAPSQARIQPHGRPKADDPPMGSAESPRPEPTDDHPLEFEGRVRGLRTEPIPRGLQAARWLAGAWLVLALVPLVAGLACILAALMLLLRTGPGLILAFLGNVFRGPERDRGRIEGQAFEVVTPDARSCTVKVRGYVVGSLAEDDEVWVQTHLRRNMRFLRRGLNRTQGDLAFRPPLRPWPMALAAMAVWTGIMLLFLPT